MSDLWTDIRHALRRLRRSPGFAALAVTTLGIGIGAATAVFSVVRPVLLGPLPYAAPEALVDLSEATVERPGGWNQVSLPTFQDWREGTRTFRGMAAYAAGVATATLDGESERLPMLEVTPDLFAVLGVWPAAGRGFGAEEGLPGNPRVVVVSHEYATRRFGSAAAALGRTMDLSRVPATVVGVMPAGFAFPSRDVALWTPLIPASFMENRGVHLLHVIARLAPGVALEAARADLTGLARRLGVEHAAEHPGHGAAVTPLRERLVGDLRATFRLLIAAVGGVLLLACANLAHLLLTRAAGRRSEMTVRAALGAGSGRIIRHLLAEGLAVSVLGGALGVAISIWVTALVAGRLPWAAAQPQPVTLDASVLAFALGLSILTGLVAATLPAWRVSRLRIAPALREAGARATGGAGRGRFRSGLVVMEVAVSFVLLLAGGLLVASFAHVLRVDPGFRTERLLTMAVSPSPIAAPEPPDIVAFYERARARVAALPGVETVSAANLLPISGGTSTGHVTIDGRAFGPGEEYAAEYVRVQPNYFRAMGVPLESGREFDERDDGDPMTVIISASMARRLWPGGDALGRRIKIGVPEFEPWLTIVGVVGDVRNEALDVAPAFTTYEPHAQRIWRTMRLVVRTAGDPLGVAPSVQDALRQLDAGIIVYDVASMEQRIGGSLVPRRFLLAVLGAFAVLALALALVGVYAVIAYTVVQQTRELGIRLALGARAGAVLRLVLGQATAHIAAGIALGLLAALALFRGLQRMLYGVETTNLFSIALVATALFAVALLAAFVPARRAARVDPMEALRHE